jgi:hypothetical protein
MNGQASLPSRVKVCAGTLVLVGRPNTSPTTNPKRRVLWPGIKSVCPGHISFPTTSLSRPHLQSQFYTLFSMGDQETTGGLTNVASPYLYDWNPDVAELLVPEAHNGQVDETSYAIQKLSGYLTIEQNWIRLTAGLDYALLGLQSSDHITSTFRSHGFWAWLTIFLARLDDSSFVKIFQILSQFSVSTLSHVAFFVSQTKVESSLQQCIQHSLWTDTHGYQRRSKQF